MRVQVPRSPLSRPRSCRGGSVMVYTVTALVALTGIVTLAVDYGHAQAVRAEMQRSAEAAARGWIDLILLGHNPSATATGYAAYLAQSTYNPIDGPTGTACTVNITPGTWDPTTSTFTPNASSTSAVRVTISRTAAAGNALPLFWGRLLGEKSCDIHASATAALVGGQSGSVSVPSIADPYLAGMPAGSTAAIYGDNTSNATPYQATASGRPRHVHHGHQHRRAEQHRPGHGRQLRSGRGRHPDPAPRPELRQQPEPAVPQPRERHRRRKDAG